MTTTAGDLPQAGDTIEVTEHRVGESARRGEILEVLGEAGHEHFRVRWDDGNESVFYPSSDATIRRRRRAGRSSSAT